MNHQQQEGTEMQQHPNATTATEPLTSEEINDMYVTLLDRNGKRHLTVVMSHGGTSK